MNTSYHKSRIVDNGWKSVILNCVSVPFYYVFPHRRIPPSQRPHDSKLPSLAIEQQSNTKDIQGINHRSLNSTLVNLPKPKIEILKQVHGNEQSNISIISKLEIDIHSSANISTHSQQEYEPAQSTSNTNKIIPGRENAILLVRNISPDLESDDGDKMHRKSYRLRTGEEILRNMWNNINNEDSYMHYFRQLVEFESSVNCCENGNLDIFQIIQFSISNGTKQCKIKGSGICVRNDTVPGTTKTSDIGRFKNKPLEEITLKVNFSVELLIDRIQIRQVILKHFQIHCDDKKSYESFINGVFNFEESLICN
jgi:hypothetical protein